MTTTLSIYRMADVQVGFKARMRELSLGPIAWGFWSWTFHDGSCWAALCFNGEAAEDRLVAWAGMTLETDVLPVVGVFVREDMRGRGLGAQAAGALLRHAVESGILYPGAAVFASTQRWSRWSEICESAGLRCLTWQ